MNETGDEHPVDQEIRINELKEQVKEVAGEPLATYEAEDAPPGAIEEFWRHVLEYEAASDTTDYEELRHDGIDLPAPEELDDATLSEKLWVVVHALARRQTFLVSTDHLSDRELYEDLWEESLHEVTKSVPASGWVRTIDLVSSGSEEDITLFLRYYADDETRDRWAREWPDHPMPPKEKPPYDRDRLLPKPERD
jgi:hypothetical protein